MKPLLRWAGSKAQLLPELRTFWREEYQRYVEPFCGSASLFLSLKPKAGLLSDINEELVIALQQVQLNAPTLVECIRRMPISEKNYYKVRATRPDTLSPALRAARFIYLNALCFNGLYRTNRAGQFNVPYGSKLRKTVLDEEHLHAVSSALQSAEIVSGDFESSVLRTGSGDFLYVDPPYTTSDVRMFTEYSGSGFGISDLHRLLEALDDVASKGVAFVLSYADVSEVSSFAEKWKSRRVSARRNIAGFTGSRRTVQELIVTNCE
ncbi:DNA adenine methylase [Pseudoxanthomonas sacheonensis]|uniref:Site-specific DNA-methyltransferase (adenine-specific) n=1 Tax=Pseudoxanthomonas sacheonensis TaxID=443615 RepID=A0ABU1RQI8_9GAMM|nr:Dam family site-specific DNA-(adenine-N6)-methyltransferase [Pseudoxanthomonas sacheonensis]MDR6841026.1 DNA adenine methylase [Pseudoxanthomonas sacheonensis]